ncbi:MAG: phosphatase PAP2 family protein [Parcubacteria group bacterium]|nr:phosphatase PAP2 family protein [Parcubacteria group bacterium]
MYKKENLVLLLVVVSITIGGYVVFKNSEYKGSIAVVQSFGVELPRTILDPFDTVSGASSGKDMKRDALRFSNTSTWEQEFLYTARRWPVSVPDWQRVIVLPPPPENTSVRTNEEIALLKTYKDTLRTPERLKKILDEVSSSTTKFGDFTLADYLDGQKFPLTTEALNPVMNDLLIFVFNMKYKYDRVRPSVLDPNLSPVIAVPGHPAYPSGHSSQMHFLAYFLSELMPDKSKLFEARADEIGIDREIAGLHYPSDTKAGQLLARQYMDILLNDPKFKAKLLIARAEWQ